MSNKRSLFQIIGVDLAFTLVAIAAVLLAVRMRPDDNVKDIADSALVSLDIPDMPACVEAQWTAKLSGGARVERAEPSLGQVVPGGLPQVVLLSSAGDSRMVCSVKLTMSRGCGGAEEVVAAANDLINGFTIGPDLPTFEQKYRAVASLAVRRRATPAELAVATRQIQELEALLFDEGKWVFDDRRKAAVSFPLEHAHATGFAAYRIDTYASTLGIKSNSLYQRFIDMHFAPGHKRQMAIYQQLKKLGVMASTSKAKEAAIERGMHDMEILQFMDPKSETGEYLRLRMELMKALGGVYDRSMTSPAPTPKCFDHLHAKGDGVAYLLAIESLSLLAKPPKVKVVIDVQASGDLPNQPGTKPLCIEIPFDELLKKGPQELANIRFRAGKATSITGLLGAECVP